MCYTDYTECTNFCLLRMGPAEMAEMADGGLLRFLHILREINTTETIPKEEHAISIVLHKLYPRCRQGDAILMPY